MSHPAARYSHAVQLGLAASVVVAVGLAVFPSRHAANGKPDLVPPLQVLAARASELAVLIGQHGAGLVTDTFVRVQARHWQHALDEAIAEVDHAEAGDDTGAAHRAHDAARPLLRLGERFVSAPASVGEADRAQAQSVAHAISDLAVSASRR